jgi:FkbM family methyltransferase
MVIERVCEHTFLPALIAPGGVILDCGVNYGRFSRWASESTSARVFGFEPDPRLFPELARLPRVEYIPCAVGAEEGVMTLYLGTSLCSSGYYPQVQEAGTCEVRVQSLPSFLNERQIQLVDLVKLDIEGAELAILERLPSATLRSMKQITVEFHDFLNAHDQPRIRAILRRMRQENSFVLRTTWHAYGDVLFINQDRVRLSVWNKLSLIWRGKYRPGLLRIVRRLVRAGPENHMPCERDATP